MVLIPAMVFGVHPTPTANAMEVTFASFEDTGDGTPLGDYLVAFAPGDFPFAYEAYEGQENLVFSQYVTVTNDTYKNGYEGGDYLNGNDYPGGNYQDGNEANGYDYQNGNDYPGGNYQDGH